MPETDRLSEPIEWIDLDFVERERTLGFAIQVGIQLNLAVLSLPSIKQYYEKLGVNRDRIAIHDRVRRADLQPDSDVAPNQIAVDGIVIRVNGQRHWLYAAVDADSN
jgi:transposase-like protein